MLNAWATWLRASGAPESTIFLRRYHVHRLMLEVRSDPFTLTTEQLVMWLGQHDWKPNTRRSYRSSLRAFYLWAQATGRRLDNPALGIPSVRIPRSLPRPTPEAIYAQALLDSDDRVRLMLQLAAGLGLRRGEIARLRREDVHDDTGGGRQLFVRGKGRHERVIPLPDWLALEILKRPPGAIFPTTAYDRAGQSLTPERVGRLVSAALPDGWTCHTLRHRCATFALEVTNDIRAVQELLGHAKLDTVQVYTFVTGQRIRAAVDATSQPPRRGFAA